MTADRAAARVALNVLLREVLFSTQTNCQDAELFKTVVPVDEVTDYHQFVEPNHATICLEHVLSRTRSCYYTSIQEFRHEFEQLLANALAYNSPGHGKYAHASIIDSAQLLLGCCCKEMQQRHEGLAAAERKLKEALDTDEYHSKNGNYNSGDSTGPLSSLEALVAACELAEEQDGLAEDDECFASGKQQAVKSAGEGDLPSEHHLGSKRVSHDMGSPVQHGSSLDGSLQRSASAPVPKAAATAHVSGSKSRRHKSKVYIRLNKVVYLPTTFMEDNFDPSALPINCELIVEAGGIVQPGGHMVTIKSVPRQGLSTMYCMTNVMKFQHQYLNWQILNWTKVDADHIQIHLQAPSGNAKGSKLEPLEQQVGLTNIPGDSLKRKSGSGNGHSRAKDLCTSAPALHDCKEDEDETEDECWEQGAMLHAPPARMHRHASRSLAPGVLAQAIQDMHAAAQDGGCPSSSGSPSHQCNERLYELQATASHQLSAKPADANGLVQLQLQAYQQGGYPNSGYLFSMPQWGLQAGTSLPCAATLDDIVLHSFGDRWGHEGLPQLCMAFPSMPGTMQQPSQGLRMLQQLGLGSSSGMNPGTTAAYSRALPFSSLQTGYDVTDSVVSASKRLKAGGVTTAGSPAMPAALAMPMECMDFKGIMMSHPHALGLASACAPSAAAFAAVPAAINDGKRSFDGGIVTTQTPFECNLQHALSM